MIRRSFIWFRAVLLLWSAVKSSGISTPEISFIYPQDNFPDKTRLYAQHLFTHKNIVFDCFYLILIFRIVIFKYNAFPVPNTIDTMYPIGNDIVFIGRSSNRSGRQSDTLVIRVQVPASQQIILTIKILYM